eukprot:3671284-Rhodomonas_salina.1
MPHPDAGLILPNSVAIVPLRHLQSAEPHFPRVSVDLVLHLALEHASVLHLCQWCVGDDLQRIIPTRGRLLGAGGAT